MDRIALLASVAFRQSRVVLMHLHDTVLPTLDPTKRIFVRNLSRRIEQDRIFDETFLRDLEAFTALLRQLVADGTTTGWEVDECHVQGGHETLYLDDRAKALASVAKELRELSVAIAATLDAKKADVAAMQLVSE